MLEVKDVNQFYGGSHILRDVSFQAPVGECSVVLGRNGVGKTTLLKCLMGILPIKSGQILLDEPVAGMTDAETERTAELCLELKKNHTLVVVEHDMSFIDTISEKVTVLAQGAIFAEGTLAEVQTNEDVIEKYLGR